MNQVFFATAETIWDTGYFGVVKILDGTYTVMEGRYLSLDDAQTAAHQYDIEWNENYPNIAR